MYQYIGFKLQSGEYAIPILKVREIINLPTITPLPQAPEYLKGITNLRGSVIPVVDLKTLISLPQNGTPGAKVIVIASGRLTFGILVDGITGVMSIDESAIEPPGSIPHSHADQVEGVAKQNGKLIIIFNPKKLIPVNDVSLLEDAMASVQETGSGGTVEVTRTLQTMAGEVKVKELRDAREFLEKSRGACAGDARLEIMDDMMAFLTAVTEQKYGQAEAIIETILKKRGQDDLFKEVGKITRKLHDTVKSFKEAIDPKLREIANNDMPNAVDRLQFVIEKTEEAANKTMSVVEKYILRMDELAEKIRTVQGPPETVSYLKSFKNGLEDDLTEVLTTQSFQDLTGQTIKKVIRLVKDIEEELVRLIATFGVKIEAGVKGADVSPEKVSQADVDDLLKEFGF